MVHSADNNHYRHFGYNSYGQGTYGANVDSRAGRSQAGRSTGCLKSILAVIGLGALAGGAFLAYRTYEKEATLMGSLKPTDCGPGLSMADSFVFPNHVNDVLKRVYPNCSNEQKEQAAKKMYWGAREQMYTDLSQEQLDSKNYLKAFEFAKETKEGPVRDGLLQKIAKVAPDLKEKAFDQMSPPRKEAAYEGMINSLLGTYKEEEGIKILDGKIQSISNHRRIRDRLIAGMSNPDLSLQLAKRLGNGPEKDDAYRKVASKYALKRDCNTAVDVAKQLNVENTLNSVDSLQYSFLSAREKIYRLNVLQHKLQDGVREQQGRLREVARICADYPQIQKACDNAIMESNEKLNSDSELIARNTPTPFIVIVDEMIDDTFCDWDGCY